MQWYAWQIKRIEEFSWIVDYFVLIHYSIDGLICCCFAGYTILNSLVNGIDIDVFGRTDYFVALCSVWENILHQLVFVSVILQKFAGKVIHCADSLICICPFPISINCFEKFPNDASCCSCTSMLVFKGFL